MRIQKNHLQLAPYAVISPSNRMNTKMSSSVHLVDKLYGKPGEATTDHYYGNITWEANDPFDATMEFIEETMFAVKDVVTGRVYPIFPREVSEYIQLDLIRGRQISGVWQVVKRNTAYGIKLV